LCTHYFIKMPLPNHCTVFFFHLPSAHWIYLPVLHLLCHGWFHTGVDWLLTWCAQLNCNWLNTPMELMTHYQTALTNWWPKVLTACCLLLHTCLHCAATGLWNPLSSFPEYTRRHEEGSWYFTQMISVHRPGWALMTVFNTYSV
jgi:hypothetical protein